MARYWRLSHGDLAFHRDSPQGTYRFSGGLGWRGGYIPYTNLSKFRYLYLKARKVSEKSCGCFYVKLKHESDQLLGSKIPIHIPADQQWHIYEILIPPQVRYTFNYIAISDPYADFELGSLLLTPREITTDLAAVEKVVHSPRETKPLECASRPCTVTAADRIHPIL